MRAACSPKIKLSFTWQRKATLQCGIKRVVNNERTDYNAVP